MFTYKKCWAEFDIERTGYIKVKDYMSFWRKLGGMFAINIYEEELSYKNLTKACALPGQVGHAVDDRYSIRISIVELNKRLEGLDRAVIHKRKQDMNMIYWETAMTESAQGVSFNQMLLMLAKRKLIVPENALLLEELLVNRKKEDAIHTLISIDRVKGLLETIALRKKFLRHMEMKKQKYLVRINEEKDDILLDASYLNMVPTGLGSPVHIESPLMSPSVASLGYLSDENEHEMETEWTSLAIPSANSSNNNHTATDDSPGQGVWHERSLKHHCLDIQQHYELLLMDYASTRLKAFLQTHENVKHAIAGAGAGVASSMVVVPLDVVKTRLQNQGKATPGTPVYRGTAGTLSRIWTEEGIRGLYRGLGPTVFGYLPTWAIYFTAYDYCKAHWGKRHEGSGHEWLVHIFSAMTAGATSTSLTNPLWVIKTRFMTQNDKTPYRYNNTIHAFRTILNQEGVRGFYKGLGSSLIGVSHVAVQFPLYEELKSWFAHHDATAGNTGILLASSLSKMAASTATYPHEVIRTRLQNQTVQPFKYNGIVHAFKIILEEEGYRGFYKGMPTNLLRTVPSSALTILTYEVIVHRLDILKNSGP